MKTEDGTERWHWWERLIVPFGIVVAVVMVLVQALNRPPAARTTNDATGPSASSVLDVTGGKNTRGFSFTNRERSQLSHCHVTALDGERQWVARAGTVILPSETTNVPWGDFQADGQPMPGYIGRNKKNFIVACEMDGIPRSAGLSF